jgi:gluconokinase
MIIIIMVPSAFHIKRAEDDDPLQGVSGCGKSTLGRALASAVPGTIFIDADDLHPPENVQLMRAGVALDDLRRWPWLWRVRDESHACEQRRDGADRADERKTVVVACSALKADYRAILRSVDVPNSPNTSQPLETHTGTHFVYMHGDRATLLARLHERESTGDPGHYMRATMLDGQLAALEEPSEEDVVKVRVEDSTELQLRMVLDALGLSASGSTL